MPCFQTRSCASASAMLSCRSGGRRRIGAISSIVWSGAYPCCGPRRWLRRGYAPCGGNVQAASRCASARPWNVPRLLPSAMSVSESNSQTLRRRRSSLAWRPLVVADVPGYAEPGGAAGMRAAKPLPIAPEPCPERLFCPGWLASWPAMIRVCRHLPGSQRHASHHNGVGSTTAMASNRPGAAAPDPLLVPPILAVWLWCFVPASPPRPGTAFWSWWPGPCWPLASVPSPRRCGSWDWRMRLASAAIMKS